LFHVWAINSNLGVWFYLKKQTKINLCIVLLAIGLLTFILQLFVFEAPDGIVGFLLCMISIFLIIGSVIKLCQLSQKIKNFIIDILDLFF